MLQWRGGSRVGMFTRRVSPEGVKNVRRLKNSTRMMRWRAVKRFGCFTGMVLPGFVKTVATFKGLKRTESHQRESGMPPLVPLVHLVAICIRWPAASPSPRCNASTFLTLLTPRHPLWLVPNAKFGLNRSRIRGTGKPIHCTQPGLVIQTSSQSRLSAPRRFRRPCRKSRDPRRQA